MKLKGKLNMSWYVDAASSDREDFIKAAYQSKIFRFWVEKGETKEIMFIGDEKFGVHEHTVQLNGFWKQFTCAGGDCVLCGMEKTKRYTEYYSILDFTKYVSKKDGKEHAVARKALGVTKDISTILESRRKSLSGSLLGKKFKVTRHGDKSPNCGNDWEHVPTEKVYDLSKLPNELKPFDFKEALRPRPRNEILSMLNFANTGFNNGPSVNRSDLMNGTTPPHSDADAPPFSEDHIPF